MSHNYETVAFPNRKGWMLFGILQPAPVPVRDEAVVLLSPGIKNRVGPHRLYVKMAERFNQLGFTVLRVDPHGLGDSEGRIEQALTADVYASIQLGRYIEDTVDMLDWMEQRFGFRRFVMAGLCGGAITALLAAEKDDRVQAILALGIPCVLDSSEIDPARYITSQQLGSIRQKYISKIFDPEAWMRFLRFKTDYRLLVKSMLQPLLKRKQPGDAQELRSNLNPHFHRAFLSFVRKKKLFLIFSQSDRLFWEFEEKYLAVHRAEIESFQANYRIEIVPDANHVFSFTEWQQDMFALSETWLNEVCARAARNH